ncbi:Plasma kallikrein [Exaiptasia diaphana]|nr:Plasma kallikrein [Exaiptasia diaphana]
MQAKSFMSRPLVNGLRHESHSVSSVLLLIKDQATTFSSKSKFEMKFFVIALLMLLGALCVAAEEGTTPEITEEIECGTKGKGNDRVVDGDIATKGSHPWQISIKRRGDQGFSHFCGGSIIKSNWIITAAHCFKNNPTPADYKVTAGEFNLGEDEGDEQDMDIDKIINHPDFDRSISSRDFDIALLKLKTNIRYDENVRPICLPSERFPPGTECTVSGWGKLNEENSEMPSRLRQAVVPLVSQEDCERAYRGINSRMLCAGFPQGGTDSCNYDSGGPLVCKNKSGVWEQVGVVSFGKGCARPRKFHVYAKIEEYKDWIQKTVAKN